MFGSDDIGIHVCIVDLDVGMARKPVIIEVKRGDYLIGPDNGVLLPAVRMLGGDKKVFVIINKDFMLLPISPIFHGRHIFSPVAAHLSNGVPIDQFGPVIRFNTLEPAPYQEATIKNGVIEAEVITINKFGSLK
ncbi:MAG: SAM-dependent chlorinase/fluorinase [Candidatus Levyibacteriota bacterium]|nr:MAG: SAM-dependent chlorinase/fluorinase [Candidatus Levybacteria bacterium]